MTGRGGQWSGSASTREDVTLAAAVGVVGLLEVLAGMAEQRLIASVCVAGMAVALAFRRWQAPLVLVAVLALFFVQSVAGVSVNAQLAPLAALLVAAYSVGAHTRTRTALVGLALGLLGVTAVIAADGGAPSDHGFGLLVVAGPWLAGQLVRRRTLAAAAADAKAEAVAATAQAQARQAAEDERARIARELHDVISHSLSAMVVQATAAAELVDRDPHRARAAIDQVQLTGREAMVEMKHLLGVLRPPAGQERIPQPTLDDLGDLVRSERASGRSVALEVVGDPRELPRGLELSAYRIVQEALTNTRKHAADASATVSVRFEKAALEVEVMDDAPGRAKPAEPGFGLIGIRERAQLYAGRVEAGPRDDAAGWRVLATFPLEAGDVG